jgi:ABC-type transport system involved in multi-copper enzyme maturation permease subunit
MKTAAAIALYSFREAVRNKILYSILFFAILLILLSVVLGSASVNQDSRFLLDIGLFSINIFGDIIAIFLGITSVFQEIERKTLYNVLSKPIDRATYFLGKFGGIAMTLAVQLLLMAAALSVTLLLRGGSVDLQLLGAFWLTYVESVMIASFALFCGSFSTPYVSGFITLGVWLIGRLVQELAAVVDKVDEPAARHLLRGIVALAPDLNFFTITTQLTYGYPVGLAYFGAATLYGLGYIAVAMGAAIIIFRRRDFI